MDTLRELRRLCGAKAVSFSIHYYESDDSWEASVSSCGEGESTEIKHWGSLESTILKLKAHLEAL